MLSVVFVEFPGDVIVTPGLTLSTLNVILVEFTDTIASPVAEAFLPSMTNQCVPFVRTERFTWCCVLLFILCVTAAWSIAPSTITL